MLISQVRCADLPPAGRKNQKNHFVACLGKNSKIDPNKKNAKLKKSIHQTMFCEKRQMGNVLEIVIFVIRTFLVEAATHLGPFD